MIFGRNSIKVIYTRPAMQSFAQSLLGIVSDFNNNAITSFNVDTSFSNSSFSGGGFFGGGSGDSSW